MSVSKPQSIYTFCLSFLILLFVHTRTEAEVRPPGVLKKDHLEQLRTLREKAGSKAAQNLNRFAIEDLKLYDRLLDSLSEREITDSIMKLESEYDRSTGGRKAELERNRSSIEELKTARVSNESRYNNLLRKAGIAFAAWFIIVFIILQIRKKHLRKQERMLSDSNTKLQSLMLKHEQGEKTLRASSKILEQHNRIHQSASALLSLSEQDVNLKNDTVSTRIKELEQKYLQEINIDRYLNSLGQEPGGELELTEINPLCAAALEITYRGNCAALPQGTVTVSTDLEKNLPKIKVVPDALRIVLLNILDNAFRAVKQKHETGLKGYVPKVVLSTRILPRFVQIRIRDNGAGIPKDQLDKIREEFVSLRPLEDGAGLGISESIRLLGEPNKGELIIESDPDEGTDVYIKLYLQN